jgi:hypothetical protein
MTKKDIQFFLRLQAFINKAKKTFGQNFVNVDINHNVDKDYYTIDCYFRSGNAEYKNCVVFYISSLDLEETIESLEEIYNTACKIL